MQSVTEHYRGDAGETAQQLLLERVRTLYKHGPTGAYFTLAAATVLVAMVATRSPEVHLWYWLIAMGSVLLLRGADMLRYRRALEDNEGDPQLWLGRFTAGVLATTLVWDSFIWLFFPQLDVFGRSAVAVVFAVMATGSINMLAANQWLGSAYSILMLLPPSLVLLFDSGSASLLLGTLGLTWSALLIVLVHNAHRDITHSLQLSRQNRELTLKAQQRQLETMELNAELSLARSHLMDANASLEEKVRERTAELEHEIAERLSYQRELERMANEDPLTGLANRTAFFNRVRDAIEQKRMRNAFAVFFVDLDRFKEINDGLGHPAGDSVLKTIADRLKSLCGHHVVCGRWGGDEFVILQLGIERRRDIDILGDLILQRVAEPIDLYRATVTVGASIGISLFPEHGEHPDELIEHADIAVYQAKHAGRSIARLYQPEWGQEARMRLELVQALRRAIDNNGLSLAFQPIVSVPDMRVVGMEALCRWNDPERGAVPPGVFIPIAEESGMMPQLGRWVLRHACETTQRLCPDADGPLIAINVSVAQLLGDNFVDEVRRVLADTGLSPRRLELELTESLFADKLANVEARLQELRVMGIRISIDDFGTGYSSMSYLRRFPLDILKIDRSFVKDLASGGEPIVSTIIRLAHSLNLEVIVEGIETVEELQHVMALGAYLMQGFLLSKPMSPEEAYGWVVPQLDLAPPKAALRA